MKIANTQLQMASSHQSHQEHTVRESLSMWTGQRPPISQPTASTPLPRQDLVNLSETGKSTQSAEQLNKELKDAVDKDPQLNLIRDMLEFLTGEKIRVFGPADLNIRQESTVVQNSQNTATAQEASAGYGVEYNYHESYSEMEETRFSAQGKVITADGEEIQFNIEVAMSRSYYEESNISLRLGDPARQIDPLVLNFDGNAAQLTNQRFAFDLDSNGTTEQINFTQVGSGFLVIDKNKDGKINNGSEMFGPQSGNGFAELAVLDDDQNGWIDENDRQFNELAVWQKSDAGTDTLLSLKALNVGALSLQHLASPFLIKNNDNQLLGTVSNSGIFLHETGETGTIQQIDLTA